MAKPKKAIKPKSSKAKKLNNKVSKVGALKVARTRLTKKNRADWETKSHHEQSEYLKEHPDSKYAKLGVTKKPVEHDTSSKEPSEDLSITPVDTSKTPKESSSDGKIAEQGSDTSSSNNPFKQYKNEESTQNPIPDEDKPLVHAQDPKTPIHQRIKNAVRDTIEAGRRIAGSTKEAYSEGIKSAIENPLKQEELQKRLKEYQENPPTKPKDNHDYLAMAVGAAAIIAIGGLAIAAPGLAIVVGLQLVDKAPELYNTFNERQKDRLERQKEQEDGSEYTKHDAKSLKHSEDTDEDDFTSMIGDEVDKTINKENEARKQNHVPGSDYFDKRISNLIDQDSEAYRRLEKKWAGDTNWKRQEEDPAKSDSAPSDKENNSSETGENQNEENEESTEEDSTTDESDLGNEDDDSLENDDDYEEDPVPPKRSKSKVKASVTELIESSFDFIDSPVLKFQDAINKGLEYIRNKENVRAKETSSETGTYAALKLHPSSARLLSDWTKSKGIENAYPPGELHVTICYSKKPIDYKPLSFIHGSRELKPKELGLLGREEDKRFLVLHLQDKGFPKRRFDYAQSIGATHDFPNYLPHISLAPAGHGIEDPSSLDFNGFDFPLLVDYEYSDVLKVNASVRDIPLTGWVTNKPNPVKVRLYTKAGVTYTRDGAKLEYSKGDIQLCDKLLDVWPVKPSIFKDKYIKQPDGTYDKRKSQYAYRINEDKPVVIQTLEGPVTANVDDVIMTGTRGEEWPISRYTFNRLYSVIIDEEVKAYLDLQINAANRIASTITIDEIPEPYNKMKPLGRGTTTIVYPGDNDSTVTMFTKDRMRLDWLNHAGIVFRSDIIKERKANKKFEFRKFPIYKCTAIKLFPIKSSEERKEANLILKMFQEAQKLSRKNSFNRKQITRDLTNYLYSELEEGTTKTSKLLYDLGYFLMNYDENQYFYDLSNANIMKDAKGNLVLSDPVVCAEIMEAVHKTIKEKYFSKY